jgi:trehalose 6-phosphate phosphatase
MLQLDTQRLRRRLPHLLKPRGRAALTELASGRVLVVFDFDGTLAPIADRPEAARMTGRTRKLLARVARLYPCAVISGRSRRDLLRRLRRIPVVAVAGSHGAEAHGAAESRPHSLVRSWVRRLRRG